MAITDAQLDEVEERAKFCRAGCEASYAVPGLVAEIRQSRTDLKDVTTERDQYRRQIEASLADLDGMNDIYDLGRALPRVEEEAGAS